jgi:hypothetical protein
MTYERRAANRHRQFHLSMLAAAPTPDDIAVLRYYLSRFQVFY